MGVIAIAVGAAVVGGVIACAIFCKSESNFSTNDSIYQHVSRFEKTTTLRAICKQWLRVKTLARVMIRASTNYCSIGACRVYPTLWPSFKLTPLHKAEGEE